MTDPMQCAGFLPTWRLRGKLVDFTANTSRYGLSDVIGVLRSASRLFRFVLRRKVSGASVCQ
jgi:hypothetical protein